MREPSFRSRYDVVVIGAGLGGLTSAALLSRAGLSVCVLEMDARPGGYLAGFRRKDHRFDSAIHWLNQLGPNGLVTRLFDLIGPDHPTAAPQKRIKRYKGDSFDHLLTDRPDELKEAWIREFPHERAGIERFFRDARRIGEAFAGLGTFMRTEESKDLPGKVLHLFTKLRFARPFIPHLRFSGREGVRKGLSRYFTDERLQRVFASEMDLLSCLVPIGWAYVGDYQLPPVGGSQVFPEWLVHVITSLGNEVHYKCRVDQVLLENGRTSGVRVTHRGTTHEVRADQVVAACDLEALYERMLPAHAVPDKLKRKLRDAELYPSSVTVALALDRPTESFGFGEEMIYLSKDDVPRERQCTGGPEEVGISILAPSLRDPSLAPDGMGTLTIYIPAEFADHDRWRTGADGTERGEAYERLKQEYADILIRRVEERLAPGLSRHIVYCDVATPITHWRYTGNRNGSMMGARPGKANFKAGIAHYRTPVKGLYLGGHWAELGGGVPIAVRAGANAAMLVLKDRKHPAAPVLAAYMDGRITLAEVEASGRFTPYTPTWMRNPTPSERKRSATVLPTGP
ncbi:MAG TPA: NAD(P)/FAD-dependent oxidoreductase [Flavobacteriales bacterium]|nr:NAD(P)/FAD-dependent oxidoreductase [Flavobacteriales bacterium]HMR27846.1 NAD(P)/FAD-dependent oxidoreductase [Flavobacteriales bacterium]